MNNSDKYDIKDTIRKINQFIDEVVIEVLEEFEKGNDWNCHYDDLISRCKFMESPMWLAFFVPWICENANCYWERRISINGYDTLTFTLDSTKNCKDDVSFG